MPRRALSRALALNPNLADALHWQAGLLGGSGRLREELAVRQRLDAIDPLNVANLLTLNGALRDSGKPTEARAVTARLLRAFPTIRRVSGHRQLTCWTQASLAEAQVPAARVLALKSNWAPQLNAGIYYALGDFEKVLSLQGSAKVTGSDRTGSESRRPWLLPASASRRRRRIAVLPRTCSARCHGPAALMRCWRCTASAGATSRGWTAYFGAVEWGR